MRELEGRTAIITGASQGLGKAIAEHFLKAGARVLICARTAADLASTAAELREVVGSTDDVIVEAADVSLESDVARIVDRALGAWQQIDILVNNAAVYGPIGLSDEVPWSEWVRAIEVNLFGSVLMARAVLPHMKQRGYGKVIQLSGGGGANPLPRITGYAASKAAVVRFAESLADEVREFKIDVNAIAPGTLDTRMLDAVIAAGPERAGVAFHARMVEVQQSAIGSRQSEESNQQSAIGSRQSEENNQQSAIRRAAQLAVFLASKASDGITGRLISAPWDDWETLPARAQELADSDIYTVRRITAADRRKDWDRG